MSKKYVVCDASGLIVTQLIEGVHDIPKDAVQVSEDLFFKITQERDGVWRRGDNNNIYKDKSPTTVPNYGKLFARVRYGREVAGIDVDGVLFDTSRDGQALLMGAALHAIADPEYVCVWKAKSGVVELTATKLIAVAKAMRAHIQGCFDRERELLGALESGKYVDEMLDQGWPG